MTTPLTCRFCHQELTRTFVDLGATPLANSYLREERDIAAEKSYPLHARVCVNCFLVQVEDVVPAEDIFSDYAYFSSFSSSWVEHARRYAEKLTQQLGLGQNSLVIEIASNDGYLLKHFVDKGIPVLGIEPAANVAKAADAVGVKTEVAFFGIETANRLAKNGLQADLMAANNVMAHVPDINDFIGGIPILLSETGVFTIEFPHLLNLIEKVQFDTIYHEHYSYLSLLTVEKILGAHGLKVFDVEELPTHGGSLRVYACHKEAQKYAETAGLSAVREKESAAGLDTLAAYGNFTPRVETVRDDLLAFLQNAKAGGKTVAGYGAAAKGNTLLNYCGVGPELIEFVVDRNPEKQGTLLPGSHIPVFAPDKIWTEKPDYVLILPWNLAEEISTDMAAIRDWGGRFVIPIPELEVLS
ncbi:methyltransferase domain-containing protein [Sneathiella chungangensis]|uniref:Methyltransferase domain-containing protein n=1 Tax=Sneathiella chungangensis TaxID=1418234 RepID=A0A845MED1_9PROT|nr:class I SAM-dependent methyltransferase [Sneathiella chungangensis]MZR22061.1 methyltransferase domain-containing protein [Sneathiella chungangensis]